MVAGVLVSLNSATATSPLASGLVSAQCPLSLAMMVACLPSGSWSTAITSGLVEGARVAGETVRRSVPAISGAAISDHRLNSLRYSASLWPPLPISSMSGSFHAPGPASEASCTFFLKFDSMLLYWSWMSPVVRHRLPIGGHAELG